MSGRDDSVADAQLRQLLDAWRREIDREPISRLMDTDTALTMIRDQSQRGFRGLWRRLRGWRPQK